MKPLLKALPASLVAWTVCAAAAYATPPFPDVPENFWAADAVHFTAIDHAFMAPEADGKFHGQDPFTRRYLVTAMDRLITELEGQSKVSWTAPGVGGYTFQDMASTPDEQAIAIKLANQYHLFEGLPGVSGASLDADKPITRYELALVLDRLLRLGEARTVIDPKLLPPRDRQFSDLPPDAWDVESVKEVANRYQVMVGFPDGTFRGPEELTRYQFAAAARQTFPLVRALVQQTIEETPAPTPTPTPMPTPTPTPTPQPLHRFQENNPVHLDGGARVDSNIGPDGNIRLVGYAGPVLGMIRSRLYLPLSDTTHYYDGDLDVGLAWTITPDFALEPFIGARGAQAGSATTVAGLYGAILSWNPMPFSIWVGGNGDSPFYATTTVSPLGSLLWDANAGIGWAFTEHFGLTLELGYGTLPLAPAASATAYGTDTAFNTSLGINFGW